jgi:hypothetical protein
LLGLPASLPLQFVTGAVAAAAVVGVAWWLAPDLRAALRR